MSHDISGTLRAPQAILMAILYKDVLKLFSRPLISLLIYKYRTQLTPRARMAPALLCRNPETVLVAGLDHRSVQLLAVPA